MHPHKVVTKPTKNTRTRNAFVGGLKDNTRPTTAKSNINDVMRKRISNPAIMPKIVCLFENNRATT
jgi:hypothetical protein